MPLDNRLLASLHADDFAWLRPHLTRFHMTRDTVLHRMGENIRHVYFPISGMVSLLSVMKSGEQIETAIVGREGVVGGSVGIDGRRTYAQATVQIEGLACQVTTAKFLELYEASNGFRRDMNLSLGVILFQAQQSAACHAIHTVEARLCRWLLQSEDIIESDYIPLTQEFLAHMLGVRRTSVSMCAHALQQSGLIKYARGRIKLIDRTGLEECACECYSAIREHIDSVLPRAASQPA